MSLRTIKYLVVDSIVDDVPDAAPEIDVDVSSGADVAAALLKTTGVPGNAEIYLQTFRPDGSARWQPVSAVEVLPEVSVMLAKIVRSRGVARPAANPLQQRPAAAAAGQAPGGKTQGVSHALGGLFKKLAVGGGSSGASAGAMGGFGRGGFSSNRPEEEEDERQLREQQMLEQLEADRDQRHGWTDMDNNAGPDPDECDGAHGDAKDSEDHVAADFADEVPAEFDDNSPAEVDEAVPADFGGDRVADNEEPGGGDWQEMDNEAGPEPDDDSGDNDNDNFNNDDNIDDFGDNDNSDD